ncbi:MAG: hypothetical protein IPI87_18985 [Betaproteobacteria bacterium]|nr:hypothetical protein [Betaproteobacteria bacterium]
MAARGIDREPTSAARGRLSRPLRSCGGDRHTPWSPGPDLLPSHLRECLLLVDFGELGARACVCRFELARAVRCAAPDGDPFPTSADSRTSVAFMRSKNASRSAADPNSSGIIVIVTMAGYSCIAPLAASTAMPMRPPNRMLPNVIAWNSLVIVPAAS